jgi:hypothetical protein
VNGLVRLAGTGMLADGSRIVWSVADGRRGRRWRAVTTGDGAISHALLLEVDPDGRPARLELTTPAGMLTVHPDRSMETLHGNIVTSGGVRHLALPWSDAHGLEIEGRPIATAVTTHRLARSVAVGEGIAVSVISIGAAMEIASLTLRFERIAPGGWRIEPVPRSVHQPAIRLELDDRGVPIGLLEGREWPLELD